MAFSQSATTGQETSKLFTPPGNKMAQTSKKKTVKDLNVDVVNLAIKVKQLEDQINGINHLFKDKDLDEKIKALNVSFENNVNIKLFEQQFAEQKNSNTAMEKKLAETTLKMENLSEKTKEKDRDLNIKSSKKYSCRVCNYTAENKSKLRNHIKLNHPKKIKCKDCDEVFSKNWKLETT